MSTLEVNKIIPRTGTTLTVGDSGDTLDFNGTKILGHGQYVVHKLDTYTYNTSVSVSTQSDYQDIAGGNYVSFTPTSTSDYVFFAHYNGMHQSQDVAGMDTYLMMGTSSSITSSDTKLNYTGQHAEYENGTGDHYRTQSKSFLYPCTSLTVGTTYYVEQAGATHNAGKTVSFNLKASNHTGDYKTHNVNLIHYKYIG